MIFLWFSYSFVKRLEIRNNMFLPNARPTTNSCRNNANQFAEELTTTYRERCWNHFGNFLEIPKYIRNDLEKYVFTKQEIWDMNNKLSGQFSHNKYWTGQFLIIWSIVDQYSYEIREHSETIIMMHQDHWLLINWLIIN